MLEHRVMEYLKWKERGNYMLWTTRRMSPCLEIDFSERPPNAPSVAPLVRALDRQSIIGS